MMNPTSNKKDFDELSTALKDMAYSYICLLYTSDAADE